jgi:hypothetical protein
MVLNPREEHSPLFLEKGYDSAGTQEIFLDDQMFGANIPKKGYNVLRVGFQNIGGFPLGKINSKMMLFGVESRCMTLSSSE